MRPAKSVIAAGVIYCCIALFHIPDSIFPHGFDKDAPAQLVSLTLAAAVYLVYIALHYSQFSFASTAIRIGLALPLAVAVSTITSGNIVGSIIGDSGRFVGSLSTWALLVIAVFHGKFSQLEFRDLLKFYVGAVQLVVLAGLAQHLHLIELPGDQGVASTLGNSDFFAAFVATSLPLLILLAIDANQRTKIILSAFALLDIYMLKIAGPLQSWVDIALILVALFLFAARKYIPRVSISLNKRTYLATFAIVIWAEFIFLMPFLGKSIPVLGNDMQVKIRGNFWITGIRQFIEHPIFGVGPDQYGNYFEKYRTLSDVQQFPNILSNDAHSASVQTLATLGLVGTLAYIALIALVVRSLLILWDTRTENRKVLAAFSLYLFIYLTNSFISPITLAHKYLMWAVCGYLVGRVYRLKKSSRSRAPLALWTIPVIFVLVAGVFTDAQIRYLSTMEKYAADNAALIPYRHSIWLPCFMYADAEQAVANNYGSDYLLRMAQAQSSNNPRCMRALTTQAQLAVDHDDLRALLPLLKRLEDVAPWRATTISAQMFYANRTGNSALKETLQLRMKELGLVYVPGRLG